uniref:Major facilitator superfamily (MFS) profile domain-containing protein n=1 Tax=Romanomermis culicivorax TaxID=13658 RepID=A0A915K6Y2_ROMCU
MANQTSSVSDWWKLVVLLASFLIHIMIWGLAFGAGVFQVALINEFAKSDIIGPISLICSLIPTFTCAAGPVSSLLTNKYGCRKVGMIGSLVASLALFFTRFAHDIWFLLIAFSFLGIGLGIAYIPSVVILCKYFDQRRPLAVSLAGSGLGFGTTIMPPVVQYLVDQWNWRNAVLLLSGVVLNIGALSALFHEPQIEDENDRVPLKSKMVHHIDMFKKSSFTLLWVNNFFILFALVAFYIHLPTHLEKSGSIDNDFSAALLVSVVGVGTILGRLVVGFVLQCLTFPLLIYASTMVAGGLLMICVPFLRTYWVLFTVLLGFGTVTSTLGPLLPLIISDMLGVESLSTGYGYILVAEALGSFLGPPFAGYLRDILHDYTYPMVISGSMIIFASLVVVLPKIWTSTFTTEKWISTRYRLAL